MPALKEFVASVEPSRHNSTAGNSAKHSTTTPSTMHDLIKQNEELKLAVAEKDAKIRELEEKFAKLSK